MNKITSLLYILIGLSFHSCNNDPYIPELERDKFNSKLLNTSNSKLPSNYIRSVEWKDNSTLYISYGYYYGQPNGILVYDYDKNVMTPLENHYLDFKDVICNDMIQDKAGNMYFATSTGLTILSPSGTVSHSAPTYLDSDGLIKLAFDNDGTLWTISKSNLYRYQKHIWTSYKIVSYQEYRALTIDSKNNKWIGTVGDGVYCLNSSNALAHHTKMSNSSMLSDYVLSIVADANDNVYMFSYAHNNTLKEGLYKFKDNDWVRMENLPYDFIFSPGYSDGKHIWFGSYYIGLVCYDGNKWTTINRVNSAFDRDKESHCKDISISKDKKIASALFDKGVFIGENIYGN